MVLSALELARKRGMKTVDLNVRAENKAAHCLYLALAFKFIHTEGKSWKMKHNLAETKKA